MAIVLIPIGSSSAASSACEELTIISPEQPVSRNGCPLLTKTPPIISTKGLAACVQWTLRKRDGSPVNLGSCVDESSLSESVSLSISLGESGTIVARFAGCDRQGDIVQVDGVAYDIENGVVRFCLPESVYSKAGIRTVDVALNDANGTPILINTSIVSIEPSLFGDVLQRRGPPTLSEIRMHIRDRAQENQLLDGYEFDDSEIIAAIKRPVQFWNEQPPRVQIFNCGNFPFTYQWLNAIVAELLRTAGHWYMRNSMNSSQGGVVINDRDRNREYFALADLYIREWREFVMHKKVELNMQQGWGTFGSSYSR